MFFHCIILFIPQKALEQARRYDSLANQCKSVSPSQDLGFFVRSLPVPSNAQRVPKKAFAPPQSAIQGDGDDLSTEYGVGMQVCMYLSVLIFFDIADIMLQTDVTLLLNLRRF